MKQKKFIYFEERYPKILDCEAGEDVRLILRKGYKVAMGQWCDDGRTIYCSNCLSRLSDINDIDPYAICPYCGACLFDIDNYSTK